MTPQPQYTTDDAGRISSDGHDSHMGSRKYAAAALVARDAWRNGADRWNAVPADVDGMRFLGAGIARTTFVPVGADGEPIGRYCYKVGQKEDNEAEYRACHDLRAVEGSVSPPTRLFYFEGTSMSVLVMPLYPVGSGDGTAQDRHREQVRTLEHHHNLPDMHGGNWRLTRDGHVRITDLGFGPGGMQKTPAPKTPRPKKTRKTAKTALPPVPWAPPPVPDWAQTESPQEQMQGVRCDCTQCKADKAERDEAANDWRRN